jgi:multidrug efflux system outer membrane protein
MTRVKLILIITIFSGIGYAGCKVPAVSQSPELKTAPGTYAGSADTVNTADINWKSFFNDKYLTDLIDTAIVNNQDLLITLQEIEVARNRVRARQGELLPSVMVGGSLGVEKVGKYTSQGAGDASAEITPGKTVPENLTDLYLGLSASWEVDVWGKLRSAKKTAMAKYLGSYEGRKFLQTSLVAEVANSYYELLALDNQLDIIRETIKLQQNQLEDIRVQKQAAVVTELAVKQFEAQVLNSQGVEFEILQQIKENENKINFLLGRYPQPIERDKTALIGQLPPKISAGIPSQMLKNRPDIRQAELELLAANWDTKVAKLAFYPSLHLSAGLGMQAFKPSFLFTLPESLIYSVIGDLAGPIINRNAIIADYQTANAYQVEAMYNYQKAILGGYMEVSNELSNINNLEKQFDLKSKEVDVLTQSIDISTALFNSARANYLEVLTAQRDALSSRLELIDVKKHEFNAVTNIYRSLGGGWK